MRTRFIIMTTFFVVLFILSGCSTAAPAPEDIDPASIEAFLSTDPDIPDAGKPTKLQATFTGSNLTDATTMVFEFRHNEKSEFVDGTFKGKNAYAGNYSFQASGTYEIFLHLYNGEYHITKKAEVIVP
ncbi:hypothetical protein [Paenibacillus sp. YAF4_2]|uniref:hypothetical protein n=1 Tax=Paenibacillus sp. YAF4_2 TaxID=3233085 RepID=UPI003F9CD34A